MVFERQWVRWRQDFGLNDSRMMSSLETGIGEAVWAGETRDSVLEILSWRHVGSIKLEKSEVSWICELEVRRETRETSKPPPCSWCRTPILDEIRWEGNACGSGRHKPRLVFLGFRGWGGEENLGRKIWRATGDWRGRGQTMTLWCPSNSCGGNRSRKSEWLMRATESCIQQPGSQ